MLWRATARYVIPVLAALALGAGPAFAAPPLPRPSPPASVRHPGVPLPRPRPAPEPAPVAAQPAAPEKTEKARPRLYQTACPAVMSGVVTARLLPPISNGQCGRHTPWRVSSVRAGGETVRLTGRPVLDCAMATALAHWAGQIAPSAKVMLGSGLGAIDIGTSYMCRRRNNRPDGPWSEHAFADGVDVSGFTLSNGRALPVKDGWTAEEGKSAAFLRFAHDAACGTFTTVLGPGANALHRDHFHLDLGCHGRTCTYRVCE